VCPFLADLAVGSLTILYTFSDDAEDEAWLYVDELLDDLVWMAADGRALSLLETPCVKEVSRSSAVCLTAPSFSLSLIVVKLRADRASRLQSGATIPCTCALPSGMG